MNRPRLLDLFCGAGGSAVGYHRAGFDVIGVDIAPQPHYPYTFHQADAMTFPLDGFDAIHASPPCKLFTVAGAVHRASQTRLFEPNTDLLTPTLERLAEHDCGNETPYVVENVPGAPMPDEDVIRLCGSSFGLRVRRHRLFYVSFPADGLPCDHAAQGQPVGVYGNGGAWTRKAPGGGGVKVAGADAAAALGVDWTTYQPALSQMIPPAYTEHIGAQMLRWIGVAA